MNKPLIAYIKRQLEPVLRKIRLQIVRGNITSVDDSKGFQRVQFKTFKNSIKSFTERVQNFGITSVPLPEAQCVTVQIGGSSEHSVVIACDDARYRLKGLEGGETALYNAFGDYIHLKKDGTMKVVAKKTLEIVCPEITLTGKMIIQGSLVADEIEDSSGKLSELRDTYNSHTHVETQSVTNPPTQQS